MKELIENQLWAFGFLPMLSALEALEWEEDFETCHIIMEVLSERSEKFGIELPTRFNEDAIAKMKIAFMVNFDLSGEIAFKNNWWYAEQIISKIKKFKKG